MRQLSEVGLHGLISESGSIGLNLSSGHLPPTQAGLDLQTVDTCRSAQPAPALILSAPIPRSFFCTMSEPAPAPVELTTLSLSPTAPEPASSTSETKPTPTAKPAKSARGLKTDDPDTRHSKTLSYILRHGAAKESLNLRPDGFVRVADLVSSRLMSVTAEARLVYLPLQIQIGERPSQR